MNRKVKTQVRGFRTQDGAGVSLVRVLGRETVEEFDPILMLDSFDSTNPDDYTAGFPMHPHRGIETVSYLYKGNMVHRDTLGNNEAISDGELQWMNSGSGILHEELVPAADRLLGVQLWLNLPAADKMSQPTYHSIHKEEVKKIPFEGGTLHLLAGDYNGQSGFHGDHLPLDYYDIHLEPGKTFRIETKEDASVMIFTLIGEVTVEGTELMEKTAAKLTQGDVLEFTNTGSQTALVLYMSSRKLDEPVAWAGPIVMNTRQELQLAFDELDRGTFIKENLDIK